MRSIIFSSGKREGGHVDVLRAVGSEKKSTFTQLSRASRSPVAPEVLCSPRGPVESRANRVRESRALLLFSRTVHMDGTFFGSRVMRVMALLAENELEQGKRWMHSS